MKNLITIIFLVTLSLSSFSQKLNKLGKIDLDEIPTFPDHRIEKQAGVYKVVKDSFIFEGNTYYQIPNGHITSLEVFDTEKDFIKHYNSEGKLLVTILSDRIINLKISKNANKLAFYDTKHIIQINLNNYLIDTLKGSFIYSFVDNDELIYYNPDDNSIYFKNLKISIKDYPNQIVDFKGKILVVTKHHVYELIGNSLFLRYEFEGQFFDSKIIANEFYFVDKVEKRKSESFSLYKTSDFSRLILIDRKDDLNR
jgi:hypothetical protein